MIFDWQNLVALALVAVAATYLARLSWKALAARRAGGCGACPSCPSGDDPQPSGPLVSLDELVDSARHKN